MIKDFKDIDKLSPSDFELFIRDLFLAAGWSNAEITQIGKEFRHGDGGIDIFAYKGKRKFAIEAKQRNIDTAVDVKALNQLITGAKLANVTNKILVTNSYFTSEVKVRALRLGVELIDRDELQNLWVKKHSEIGRDIKPRKYQQDVINDAISHYEIGKTKLLIEMATGLGKTYTVAHLIKRLIQGSEKQPRVLFLAHQVEILLQSVTSFKNVLGVGNYSFSACFAGSTPEDTDFVFASFDTLYSQVEALSSEAFDYVVVDEAHHTPARTYGEVVIRFHPKLLIGLTATPYRTDNKDVLRFFGGSDGHIGKFDLIWALKHRKLAFPKYLVLLDDLDQDKIDQLESGLSVSDLDKLLFLHKKDEEVVKIIEKTVIEKEIENVKGIVFCRSIRHMSHLIAFFEPGTATLVHSKMTEQGRRENIRNFREGDFKFILVCDLFNEGIDIPETNLLIFMRYTGSRTVWLQQLGRGLRKTPNKDYVFVLDFVGSLERLNEIRDLAKAVESSPLDEANLGDEEESNQPRSILHDSTIEVEYSEKAAKVLKLLEQMKMQLNSREVLIEKIRLFSEERGRVPKINEIEVSLPEVSLDQVATHFGSYYSFLLAAFEDGVDMEATLTRIKKFMSEFSSQQKIVPSYRAIAYHFMYHQLFEFTEREIKQILPELQLNQSHRENSIETPKIIDSPEKTHCELLQDYKDRVISRADLKSISIEEQQKIILKYRSLSVFLKKLKEQV